MEGLVGVTAIDTSVAGFTVRVTAPETEPEVAVMVVVPTDNDAAIPYEPAELPMVATVVFDELQTTAAVRF